MCVCASVCVCMYASVHVCTDTYIYRSRGMLSIALCLVPLRQALSLNLELAVFQLVWWLTSPSDFPVSATILSRAGVTAACDHTQSLHSARNPNSSNLTHWTTIPTPIYHFKFVFCPLILCLHSFFFRLNLLGIFFRADILPFHAAILFLHLALSFLSFLALTYIYF